MERLRYLAFALILFVHAASHAEARYDSWQIRHPVATAIVSATTFGFVPGAFANDLVEVSDFMEKGWTRAGLALVQPHAEKSFQNAKIIISFLEVLIAFVLVYRISRKKR
ncbi:hypothetical protein [Noviherbaspirillum galbum]|uniref:Uncharacterized protein n=1 Tax=Noviherbaspirillum galbum TaxID=2709383 RepID=A0A6B3SSG5_9BURK|nr:hypothetical protein [Noviherbaspirillum galbum]NEX63398.1 hypothetical protein [Noviherbaspirillum galbum]